MKTIVAKKIGRRPKRKANSPDLSKAKIVAAALNLLDRRGLDSFSLRDVARALGVYPTALYWHVPNRNALLAEIVAHALRHVSPPTDAGDWRIWLRELFRRYRREVRRHPNIAPLIGARLVSNAGAGLELVERILALLDGAGFRGRSLVDAYNVVIAAKVGFVTLEFATPPAKGIDDWKGALERQLSSVQSSTYPTLARYLPELANRAFILRWENGADQPLDAAFESFIEVVLSGLAERLRKSR